MWSEAFITQARSDWDVYQELKDNHSQCHELHYLQMTTEKLSKAALAVTAKPQKSHQVFIKFLRLTYQNPNIRNKLTDNPRQYRSIINEILHIAKKIEELAPAHEGIASNSEYPWEQPDGTVATPSKHQFPVWNDLQSSSGKKLIRLIQELLERFDEFY
jgi:hypothetical protein